MRRKSTICPEIEGYGRFSRDDSLNGLAGARPRSCLEILQTARRVHVLRPPKGKIGGREMFVFNDLGW